MAIIRRQESKRLRQKPFLQWKSKRKDWKQIHKRCHLVPQSFYHECLLKRVICAWKEWAKASASDRQTRVGLWMEEYQLTNQSEIMIQNRNEAAKRLEPRIPSFLIEEEMIDLRLENRSDDYLQDFRSNLLDDIDDNYLLNHSIMQLMAKELK
jgi:hypothetical protein